MAFSSSEMKQDDLSIVQNNPSVDHGEIKEVEGQDEAAKFLRTAEGVRPMTVEDEKKLLRKIDWMVMPLMWCCYCLQYLDKTLINYANVMGLQEDTNTTGDQFSRLALIFYVSYLAFEFPHGFGMKMVPVARYIGAMVMCWGVVVTVTSACRDWGSLVTTRVLLGAFESAVAPSLILMTSMWYKRNEQPPRIGLWYQGVGVGVIFGSLLSYGFEDYHNDVFTSWQIMFLFVGLITVAVGALVFFFLPTNPMTCARLSHEEKVWAVQRLRENQTGIENKQIKPSQVWECFCDPQTWLLSLITIASNVPNGAVSSFQATIIQNLGFDSKQSSLLQIPSGIITMIAIYCSTVLAGRYNQRGMQAIALIVPGILGGGLMAFLPASNTAGRLIGNYLTNTIGASLPLLYAWVAANYAGHTKKVTMNAVLLMSFCLGNIIGPLTFTDADAPRYIPAIVTIIVTCSAAVALIVALQVYYIWQNKCRARAGDQGEVIGLEFADRTDRENVAFRYQL